MCVLSFLYRFPGELRCIKSWVLRKMCDTRSLPLAQAWVIDDEDVEKFTNAIED